MDDNNRSEAMNFEILMAGAAEVGGARLGRLMMSGRRQVDTPNYLGNTSRGVIPHVTHDNLTRHSNISGAYYALEDFLERRQWQPSKDAPILLTPQAEQARPLHSFTSTPSTMITVLGARRILRVAAGGNTANAVSIFTSTGVQALTVEDYQKAVAALQPDIAIPLCDLTEKVHVPKPKRALRMVDRTDEWLSGWFDAFPGNQVPDPSGISTFAPVLPIPYPMQWEYLGRISEEFSHAINGLAIYEVDILPDLKAYSNLLSLPRLSLDAPASPHVILRQVSLGVDLFTVPFIDSISDAGIALSFSFPPPESSTGGSGGLPLGVDISSAEHRMSLAPLQDGCRCYACTHHHRAYICHLLQAREMLCWTLIQLHNHAVMDRFFAGVRATLATGEDAFEEAHRKFSFVYEPELPTGMGSRPRARGYHFKSEGGDEKINKGNWAQLKDSEQEPEQDQEQRQ